MLSVGDLFAGIGGIALGFKRAGFNILWANEIDSKACETYKSNFHHHLYEQDIRTLDLNKLPKVDVLAGGFPCQAFSVAGKRLGFEDDRGNMFFEIMRLVDALKPSIIFLENVKNLKTHDKGETFKRILEELNLRGYHVKFKILNTCEYSDIPQNRERIYIVAFLNSKTCDNFEFPETYNNKKRQIKDLLDKEVQEKFYYNKCKFYKLIKDEVNDLNTLYQWRRVYLRKNKSNVCPTLTANMGTGGHNVPLLRDSKDVRKLTPRECARFQGFPDDFIFPKKLSDSSIYKQVGNSVSVPVVEAIARKIMDAVNKSF